VLSDGESVGGEEQVPTTARKEIINCYESVSQYKFCFCHQRAKHCCIGRRYGNFYKTKKKKKEVNCLVTNILQHIFFCAQQKKLTHAGLEQLDPFLGQLSL